MLKKIKRSLSIIGIILSKRNYFFIFLITSLLGFFVLYWLTLATVTDKSLEIFIMMSGWNYTYLNLVLLGIIALLFGIFLSIFVYKIKITKKASKTGFFGTLGLASGVFSAGCPMCGSVVFALVGAPLALFYLPFKGLELKVLSIILLLFSNYFLARSLVDYKRCKIG